MPEAMDREKFGEKICTSEMVGMEPMDVGRKSSLALRWIGNGALLLSIGSTIFAVSKGVETIMGLIARVQGLQGEISEMETAEQAIAEERENNKIVDGEKLSTDIDGGQKFKLDLPASAQSLPEACDLLAWEGMESPRNRDVYGRLLDVARLNFDGLTEIQNLAFLEVCTGDGDTMRSLMNVLMIGAIQDESREIAELITDTVNGKCSSVSYVRTPSEDNYFKREYGNCDRLPNSDFDACMEAWNVKIPCFVCRIWEEDPDECKGLSKDSPKQNCRTNLSIEENETDRIGQEASVERCKNDLTESWGVTRQYEKMLRWLDDEDQCNL